MRKSLIILIILVAFSNPGCTKQPTGPLLEISKEEDPKTNFPTYKLIFKENNEVIAKIFFKNGKTLLAEGSIPAHITNVTNVELIRSGDLIPELGLRRVKEIVYSSKGKVVARLVRHNDKFDLIEGEIPNGIIVEKYENGNIRNIFTNRNGKRDGPGIGLYPSGRIKIEVTYRDDFPSGITRRYYENGSVMFEEKFVNKRIISRKDYYENGKLKEETYSDGDKIVRRNYDIQGELIP